MVRYRMRPWGPQITGSLSTDVLSNIVGVLFLEAGDMVCFPAPIGRERNLEIPIPEVSQEELGKALAN